MAILLFISSLLGMSLSLSMSFQGVHNIRCFKSKAETGQEIYISYLISGIKEDSVSVKIKDPDEKLLFLSNPKTRERRMNFQAFIPGYYSLCFESLDKSVKVVSFDLSTESEPINNEVTSEDEYSTLKTHMKQLSIKLEAIDRFFQYYDRRVRVYRSIAIYTNDRLILYSAFKLGVFLVIGTLRVFTLIRLFKNSSQNRI
ncbi:hypothetical protein SteCoe_19473 [Stentor coeruleus]|uniref:GOLD domain-containing protein n=1 Tax=Stentor coeruleus TaxID=5963 RepID=A0A1R2BUI7_9CILI|nr:hypothetical protein SteCoe_19473 [Stentor coeruleus]